MSESTTTLQLAFEIGRNQFGRRRLAMRTGLSEMTVRLEVEHLRELRLVSLSPAGVEFTGTGRKHFARLFEQVNDIREMELTSLRLDNVTLVAWVTAQESTPAWALRDRAVREGATGLLLLQHEANGWYFTHNHEPIETHNPTDAVTIRETFPQAGQQDRLILSSAPDRRRAGLGLWQVINAIVRDS